MMQGRTDQTARPDRPTPAYVNPLGPPDHLLDGIPHAGLYSLQLAELPGPFEPFTTVDGDDLAVHVSAERAHEVGHEVGQFMMLAHAAQWYPLGEREFLHEFARQ